MTKEEVRKLDVILEELQHIKQETKNISKTLFGNGGIGMCERVRNLERTRKSFFRIPNNIMIILQILLIIMTIIFMIKK